MKSALFPVGDVLVVFVPFNEGLSLYEEAEIAGWQATGGTLRFCYTQEVWNSAIIEEENRQKAKWVYTSTKNI